MDAVSAFGIGLQIADTCCHLSTGVFKLVRKLRNAQAETQSQARYLRQLAVLLDSMKADFQAPAPCPLGDAGAFKALSQLQEMLNLCDEEVWQLNLVLDKSLPNPSDNFLKRQERNLRAVVKEESIRRHLNQLHDLLTHVILWYNHQLFWLCSKYL